jgi:RNA polymerase sigma-70 factor (ECF subfamily)
VAAVDPDDILAVTTAVAAGEPAAVAAFYRAHFPLLFTVARRATGRDEAVCLDVVQEATLRIVRTIRPIGSAGQLRAWLRLVVRTTAYDHLRAEGRRRRHEVAVVVGSSEPEVADDEQRAWLADQLAQLDPTLVRLIDLRYEQRWTLARIAAVVGLPVGTVDGRLRRAIGQLRRAATEAFDDELD